MNGLDQFLQQHGMPVPPVAIPVTPRTVAKISMTTLQQLASAPGGDPALKRAAEFSRQCHGAQYVRQNESTRRKYEQAMERHGLPAYPGIPAAIAAFLEGYRYKITSKTRETMVRVIRTAHLDRGFEDPILHEIVQDKLESLDRRSLVRDLDIRPILVPDYLKLRASILRDLRGLRDRAVIGIGFEGFLFSGPIAAMDVKDVRIDTEGVTIALNTARHSVFIPRRGPMDAVADIEEYLATTGLQSGPLFRPIDSLQRLEASRITSNSICRLCFGARLDFAGFDSRKYRFASLRAGHLINAELQNVDELQLASRAGIRSPSTLQRYRRRSKTVGALRS
jgi:integrase